MNQKPLEVISIERNGKEFILTTAYNGHEFNHPVEIVDNGKVFGLAMPDELNCILRNEYSLEEANAFLEQIKEKYYTLS